MAKEGILLESGTNEVEVLEFILGGQSFGLNVTKVQAIEQYDAEKVTKLPMADSSLAGMLLFRETTVPLLNLGNTLGIETSCASAVEGKIEERIVLVMEFNSIVSAVIADGVNRIHRISWADINPLSPILSDTSSVFTGSVSIEDREVLIVDMEKIVSMLLPAAALRLASKKTEPHPLAAERVNKKIYFAEDSNTIRQSIFEILNEEGYTNVTAFDNGSACYEAILAAKAHAESTGGDLSDQIDLIITDIEMPQMDGLTLCKKCKRELNISTPVVMFSSLINDQMASKCESVGADDYMAKPEIEKLIAILDRHCLDNQAVAV
ncbi:MAG: chemotaxis protein CheV [Phycisphaerales bacterium]|nr:chemotaxis protein CheV [Phycisphaerales bacterium]